MACSVVSRRFLIRASIGLVLVVGLGLAWLNWPQLQAQWQRVSPVAAAAPAAMGPSHQVELVAGQPGAIRVPKTLLDGARFATATVVPTPAPEPLHLPGTVILDPNRNVRIHSLFAGQVAKIGLRGDMSQSSERLTRSPDNGLRPGDWVKKGQILAIVWSKDVGTMKTELVNQLSKLRADQKVLERYKSVDPGIVTSNQLTQAQQQYESDLVAVRNAERNLRSVRLSEDEIAAVTREAEKLREPNAPRDLELERTWAEIPLRAPFDGQLVEKNVTVGDTVDTTTEMFKLANMDRLQVLANVYEEDLPKLQQIDREARQAEAAASPPGGAGESPGLEALAQAAGDRVRQWHISFQATGDVGEPGSFDKIGAVIDPMQHTGTVTGWVENRQRRLFVGQFVTATVALKPDPRLVAVPTGAVVEAADGPFVFVQTEPGAFVRRKVAVVVRGREEMFLRRQPTPEEAQKGAAGIQPNEVVLARGAVEVNGEMEALQSDAKK